MKSLISPREKLKAATLYLLGEMPIRSLPTELQFVASEFRYGTMSGQDAMGFITECHEDFVTAWYQENERIDKELGGWKMI